MKIVKLLQIVQMALIAVVLRKFFLNNIINVFHAFKTAKNVQIKQVVINVFSNSILIVKIIFVKDVYQIAYNAKTIIVLNVNKDIF